MNQDPEMHIGETVGIRYENPKSGYEDQRIGIIVSTTIKRVALLILDEDEDVEIMIPKKNIKKICDPVEFKE